MSTHRLLLGTHTSGDEQNYLMIAKVMFFFIIFFHSSCRSHYPANTVKQSQRSTRIVEVLITMLSIVKELSSCRDWWLWKPSWVQVRNLHKDKSRWRSEQVPVPRYFIPTLLFLGRGTCRKTRTSLRRRLRTLTFLFLTIRNTSRSRPSGNQRNRICG